MPSPEIVAPQAMPIGWYVNGNMADPKVQTGPIEDVLIRDLIPIPSCPMPAIARNSCSLPKGPTMTQHSGTGHSAPSSKPTAWLYLPLFLHTSAAAALFRVDNRVTFGQPLGKVL